MRSRCPEFAAGLATDPLTLAAMAQFDQHSEAMPQIVFDGLAWGAATEDTHRN